MPNDDVLYYYGAAETWTITDEQWRSVGVENQGTIVFKRAERDAVSKKDLTPEALEFLAKHHAGEFQFMGKSSLGEEKSSAPVAEGETSTGAPAPNGE